MNQSRWVTVDVNDVDRFKKDLKVADRLKRGATIGCFYIESPSIRQVIEELGSKDYIMLVAGSSIIRPGVGKSGMMKSNIDRYHNPTQIDYLHPVPEQQLKETFGVMIYQEGVPEVGIHYGCLFSRRCRLPPAADEW
nr:hypothetical protein [[Flexibacter] sp. ATCC 35208]